MDNPAWNGLVAAVKVCHTLRLREAGTVPGPQLFALRNGLVRARVRLRPVRHGSDAVAAIAAMAALAVAAQADGVVASWETLDLAAARGLPLLHNDPALNLVRATRDRSVLSRFPYREQVLPGRTPDGRVRIEPRWQTPADGLSDCLLEPAIAAMLQRSFHTLPHYWPDELERTAEHLEADGYRVTTGLDAPPDPRTLARWGRGPIGGLRPAQPRPIIRTPVRISRGSGSGRRRRRRSSPASPRPPRCPTPTRCGSIYQLHYADGRPQPVIFNEQLVPFYALQPRTDKIPLGGPR